MKKSYAALALAAGLSFLGGCRDTFLAETLEKSLQPKFSAQNSDSNPPQTVKTLEGFVESYQPSILTLMCPTERNYSGDIMVHEFEYVLVKATDRREHLLIFPHSGFLRQSKIKLNYIPFDGGKISTQEFAGMLVPGCYTREDFTVRSDGMILEHSE